MNDVAKILYDAADLIDANGWCQGEYRSEGGCYCITGALVEVIGLGSFSEWSEAALAVEREIDEPHLPAWNDTEGRTVDQVTTALRNAARTAEKVAG
jgi:hypothetical protein